MKIFAECSVPNVTYLRGAVLVNRPVNLLLCKSLHTSTYHWYPDNSGRPSIVFTGTDVEWVFDNVKQRDAEYRRLLDLTFQPPLSTIDKHSLGEANG